MKLELAGVKNKSIDKERRNIYFYCIKLKSSVALQLWYVYYNLINESTVMLSSCWMVHTLSIHFMIWTLAGNYISDTVKQLI